MWRADVNKVLAGAAICDSGRGRESRALRFIARQIEVTSSPRVDKCRAVRPFWGGVKNEEGASRQMDFQFFVQDTLDFIRSHKEWAPPIVFLLAFGESIGFVSVILPFWAMLVALGGVINLSGLNFPLRLISTP